MSHHLELPSLPGTSKCPSLLISEQPSVDDSNQHQPTGAALSTALEDGSSTAPSSESQPLANLSKPCMFPKLAGRYNHNVILPASAASGLQSPVCELEKPLNLKPRDQKLSEFLQKNPAFFPPPQKKCTFRIRLFYIYTLIIIGLTIFFAVSPTTATKTAKSLVHFIKMTDKIEEPWKFLLFSAMIISHQLFGVPLQTVTVALICFATKKFLYGYIVVCVTCVLCSMLIFYLVRRPLKNCIERNYRDNSFVQVIRAEAGLAPVKVSFLFRFMYLPGLYKNLGLSLSTINFATFIVPAVIEICLSNTINCMVGVMMREGVDQSVGQVEKKSKMTKMVTYFSYIMSGLQVVCIIIALLVTMTKMKKIRYLQRLLEIKLEREKRIAQGYIFDFESDKKEDHEMVNKIEEQLMSPGQVPLSEEPMTHQVQVFKPMIEDHSVESISHRSHRVSDHEVQIEIKGQN